ncbi:MAG: WHG domain-containing protein [Parvibaculaceae bacterium]|nr:WHG domain-containing protein [Parvibaculaceae bacterium]
MNQKLSDRDIADFRGQLVEAATKLFRRDGVEAVSLRNLAAETGCSRSTPYRYFRDKTAILTAVRIAAQERLTAQTKAALEKAPDIAAQIHAIAESHVAFALEDPDLYFLLTGSPQGRAERTPELTAAIDAYRAAADAPLHAAKAQGQVRGDVRELGLLLHSALHGLISLHLTGNLTGRISFARLRELTEVVVSRGIYAPAYRNYEESDMTPPAWIPYGARVRGTYLGKEFEGTVTGIGFPALPFEARSYTIKADAPINVSAFSSMNIMRQMLTATLSPKGESLDHKGKGNNIMSVRII